MLKTFSRLRMPRLFLMAVLSLGGVTAESRAQTLSSNLLYTSIEPCRLVDTRVAGGTILAGPANARSFNAAGVSSPGSLSSQGGNPNGCPLPGFSDGAQVQAVVLNFVAVGPAGPGDLRAWPSDQPVPNAAVINYTNGFNLANAVILPVRQDHPGGDFTVQADVSSTNLVVDVLGYFSDLTPTASQDNLFLGPQSGNTGTTGFQNAGFGFGSLTHNTSGQQNVALGASALTNNTSGLFNTAVGAGALAGNTSGTHNTAVGWNSLTAASSANSNNNTALGILSLTANSSGSNNTAVGVGALDNSTGGSSDIALGFNAGFALNGSESFDIDIGNPGVAGESNAIRIGTVGTHTAAFMAGINGNTSSSGTTVFVNSQGQLGTTTSSVRFKEDVEDMGGASEVLLRLRPVTFHYRPEFDDGARLLQYGLLAEEVAQVAPGLVQLDSEGQPVAVRYHFVNAMLLNEVQKQHRRMAEQDDRLNNQAAEIARLEARLAEEARRGDEMERQIHSLASQLAARR